MPKALEIAERLAAGAPKAIAASKVAVNAYLRSVSSMIMPLCLTAEQATMATEDHREAVRAFQEKRPAKFFGSRTLLLERSEDSRLPRRALGYRESSDRFHNEKSSHKEIHIASRQVILAPPPRGSRSAG